MIRCDQRGGVVYQKRLGILVFLFFATQVFVFGQIARRFQHLNLENGFSHSDATCFAQDRKGFMWLGSFAGLHKYDGKDLQLFLNEEYDVNQVYWNRIRFCKVKGDCLWVASDGGVALFDLTTEKYVPIKILGDADIVHDEVTDFFVDNHNRLWLATTGTLLIGFYDPNTQTLVYKRPTMCVGGGRSILYTKGYFRGIIGDNQRKVWICNENGVFGFDVSSSDTVLLEEHISERSPKEYRLGATVPLDLYYEKERLWVVFGDYVQVFGLSREHRKVKSIVKNLYTNGMIKNARGENENVALSHIQIDDDENLWAGSEIGLVVLKNPLSKQPRGELIQNSVYNPFSLSSNSLTELFLDESNCLWIGSWGGGINLLDLERKKFNVYRYDEALAGFTVNDNFVRAIDQDQAGDFWIGTRKRGVNYFNSETGEFRYYRHDPTDPASLAGNDVRSIKVNGDSIFIGLQGGVDLIDRVSGRISHISFPDELESFGVFAIEFDNFGQVWLGLWGGGLVVMKFEQDGSYVFKRYLTADASVDRLSSDFVTSLHHEADVNEMLISTKKGLNRAFINTDGAIERMVYYKAQFGNPFSLKSDFIWSVKQESDSVYWVGTLGGGLNRLVILGSWDEENNGYYRATAFDRHNGAPGNDVESLLIDDKGYVWIGGYGISRFDPRQNQFWNFDMRDGLQSNGYKIGAACKARDGQLFFGGLQGFTFFNPDDIKENHIVPKVAFSTLKVNGRIVSPGKELSGRVLIDEALAYAERIDLLHTENDFSIGFSTLHFANPGKSKFKYKLEGYDERWVYLTDETAFASYANLPYGDYVFKMDGTNNDGLWSNNPIELGIGIVPPWWLSKWGYMMYASVFLFISFVIFYVGYRWMKMRHDLVLIVNEEKRKGELHDMKLQFFTNISHEFKTPLSLILSPAEKLLLEEPRGTTRYGSIKLIHSNAKRLLKLINELLEFRKSEGGNLKLKVSKGDVGELVDELVEHMEPLIKQKNIGFSLEEKKKVDFWFDKEKVVKILSNLLSNAIKFTPNAGEVGVTLFVGSANDVRPAFKNSFDIRSSQSFSQYMFVAVKDTGKGVSKNIIAQVFDRFFQDDSSSDNSLGSGIGLALVKSLVKLHSGIIFFSSAKGVGTEIVVGFPLGNSHLKSHHFIEENNNDFSIGEVVGLELPSVVLGSRLDSVVEGVGNGEFSVLVVEDNQDLKEFLSGHLKTDYRVFTASNGKEGLEKARSEMIDLIVSDVMMPVMDGFKMLSELKKDLQTSHIPVVLLTAKSSVEAQIKGTNVGADAYLSKPVNLELLEAKIGQLLMSIANLRNRYKGDALFSTREMVRNQKDREFIDQVNSIIDDNIEKSEFSVTELSKALGMGRTNLYKKIKSLTGMSPVEFIRSQRLKRAAKILISEDISITEVIYRVGISSNSYFTKAFKAQFGVTPSEFVQKSSQ